MSLKSIVKAFRKFAMVCSGADLKTLKKDDCASEKTKYVMIGMFIFLTAIFASLSCGYALYIGFKSAWLATGVGMLWGAFIFNLDRFIVSSIRRKYIDPSSSWIRKSLLRSGEYLAASPRFLLAFLIGVVISVPLELKYFDPEITTRVNKAVDADIKIKDGELKETAKINELKNEIQSLQQAIFDKELRRDRLRDDSYAEAEGTGGTRKRGRGPVAEMRILEFKNYEAELIKFRNDSQAKIVSDQNEIARLEAEEKEKIETLVKERNERIGFLERYKALRNLAEESGTVWWATFFISFLLVVLEITPIAMKIISKRGPYDSILEADEYKVSLEQQKRISDLNEKTNNELYFNTLKRSAWFTVQEQLTRETMSDFFNLAQYDIAEAKAAAAKEVVEDWKTK
jgi:Domain of unknown function (DUF4407)